MREGSPVLLLRGKGGKCNDAGALNVAKFIALLLCKGCSIQIPIPGSQVVGITQLLPGGQVESGVDNLLNLVHRETLQMVVRDVTYSNTS